MKALQESEFTQALQAEIAGASAETSFGAKTFLEADDAEQEVDGLPSASPAGKKRAFSGEVPTSEKKGKFFDANEEAMKLRSKAKHELEELQSKCDDTTNQANETLAGADSLIKIDEEMFKERVLTLKHRAKLLIEVATGTNESLKKAVSDVLVACSQDYSLVPLPRPVLDALVSLRGIAGEIPVLGQSQLTQEELTASFEKWQALKWPVTNVVNACVSSINGLQSARTAKKRHEDSLHKKALAKAKARAKEAAKAATTRTPSPANSGSKQESLYKIFDLSFEKNIWMCKGRPWALTSMIILFRL